MVQILLYISSFVISASVHSPLVIQPTQEPAKIPWEGLYCSSHRIPTPKTLLFWTIEPEVLEESAAVCRGCPMRGECTKDRHGRTVELQPGYEALERLRGRL